MIGRDGVAEDAQRACSGDRGDGAGLHAEVLEERRLLDVGALGVPLVDGSGGGADLVPLGVLAGKVAIESGEHLGGEGAAKGVSDLGEAGPDILEEDFLAILALADGLLGEVDVDASGEREGDDERRGHQEVGLDVLVDAGLEVAVAREDGGGDKIVVGDGLLDLRVEGAGVSDAGGASVADGLEAELVEVGLEAGLLKVGGDNAGAGCQRGLHGRVHGKTRLDRLLGKESRGEHDARVAGVGAAGDGGDEDAAVTDGALANVLPVVGGLGHLGDGVRGGAVADHLLLVLRNGGIPAGNQCLGGEGAVILAVAALGNRLGEEFLEERLELGKVDTVLGTLGAGHARDDGREIELEVDAVVDLALAGHAEHSLGLEVVTEGLALCLGASCGSEEGDGLGIDGEDAHGGAVFRCHVGDGGAVGEG